MGSNPECRSILESTTYSGDSEFSCRHSLQAHRMPNRVDPGQRDLPVHLLEVLHTTEVDLFASHQTHQVPRYVSRYPDLRVLVVDAFCNNLDVIVYSFQVYIILLKPW